jgi:septum site-determining protein MinD
MGRRIVVTSGKGGVGKTTVVANLGIALALGGVSVVLVDGDIGLNNLDVALSAENRIIYDIGDVVAKKCRLKQALIRDENLDNLYLLPSAKLLPQDSISAQAFCAVINELDKDFDYVIIDCPAGIEQGFHRAVLPAREALVVTTPHISAVRDADKVLGLLTTYNIKEIGLIVNRVRGDLVIKEEAMSAREIAELLHTPLRGAIPEDDKLGFSGTFAETGSERCYNAYKMLAEAVACKGGKVYDCERPFQGLIYRFIHRRG